MNLISSKESILENKYYFLKDNKEELILPGHNILREHFETFKVVGPIEFPCFSDFKTEEELRFDEWSKAIEHLAETKSNFTFEC